MSPHSLAIEVKARSGSSSNLFFKSPGHLSTGSGGSGVCTTPRPIRPEGSSFSVKTQKQITFIRYLNILRLATPSDPLVNEDDADERPVNVVRVACEPVSGPMIEPPVGLSITSLRILDGFLKLLWSRSFLATPETCFVPSR